MFQSIYPQAALCFPYLFHSKVFFHRYSTLLEVSFSEKNRILFILSKSISKPCNYDWWHVTILSSVRNEWDGMRRNEKFDCICNGNAVPYARSE